MRIRTLLLLMPVLPLLASCTMGPNYTPPATYADGEWHSAAATQEPAGKWWEGFNDDVLDNIIDETAANNHDIRIALAHVEEAKALHRESRSSLMPSIALDTEARREGVSEQTSSTGTTRERERDSVDAGLDAAWEIDIFGRVRRGVEASGARLEAEEELLHDMQLTAVSEVARNYFEVRGLQKRIEVTKRSIDLVKAVEKLADTQLSAGAVTEFDVARARGERETIEATLPALEAEMQAGIYRISVLAGKAPEHYLAQLSETKPLPVAEDKVPVGLRSEILRRRPDVRTAERELAASSADIGVAVAERFPRFSLTGDIGAAATGFGDLFAGGATTYGIGTVLNWPVFQGGALRARVKAAEARGDAAQAAYDKAVLTALEDAEASLARYGAEWRTLRQLQAAERTRAEGFNIAKLRYEAGEETFLTLLDAERSLITAQDNLAQSETRILTRLTQLYKSLGGGWEALAPTAPKEKPL